MDTIVITTALILILLFSLSIHEFAHALIAQLFGDPTAKLEGRMTINPLAHWDNVGTTLLVALILLNSLGLSLPVFGWGKPVPVDERNFTNPRWHGFQVAIAGPISNVLIAILAASILRFGNPAGILSGICYLAVSLNVFLALFNLIPIPPLDGSRILRLFLPEEVYFSIISNPAIYFSLIFMVLFFFLNPISSYAGQLTTFLISRPL